MNSRCSHCEFPVLWEQWELESRVLWGSVEQSSPEECVSLALFLHTCVCLGCRVVALGSQPCLSPQPTPVILLKEGTDTSQGIPQLVSNINACQVIAEAVRTTLGPRGMDKLIVDDRGRHGFVSVQPSVRVWGSSSSLCWAGLSQQSFSSVSRSLGHLDVPCRTKDSCQSSLRIPCLLPRGTWRDAGSVGLDESSVSLCQTGETVWNLPSGIFGHLSLFLNEAHYTCGVTQYLFWLSVRSVDIPGLIFNLFLECDLEMSFTVTLKRLV